MCVYVCARASLHGPWGGLGMLSPRKGAGRYKLCRQTNIYILCWFAINV